MGLHDILFTLAVHHDFETKELRISLTDVDNACFLGRDFQFQSLGNPLCNSLHGFLRVLTISAEDTEVIRIAHDEHFLEVCLPHFLVAFTFVKDLRSTDDSMRAVTVCYGMFYPLAIHPVVKFVQHHVCQQRGDNPTLRCSFCWIYRAAIRHTNRRFQNPLDYE